MPRRQQILQVLFQMDGRIATVAAAACLMLSALTGTALAGCNDLTISGASVQLDVTPDFNPLSGVDLVSNIVSITITNPAPGNCPTASLQISQAPETANPAKVMLKGTEQLVYRVESVNSLVFAVPSGGTAIVQVRARILSADNPFLSAGTYQDTNINKVYVYKGATPTANAVVATAPFSATAHVASVCDLPSPSVTTLDFSSAISNGLPNPASILTTGFAGVRCTNPATVKLTADAMRPASAPSAPPGFDNFINFTANASFGSATVSLTTDPNPTEDTATSSTDTGTPTQSGSLSLNVHLVRGSNIVAGSYASTIIVSVDPRP